MFKYNKAWIAAIAAPVSLIVVTFITTGLGIEVAGLDTVVAAAVTGALTWLVPNIS